MAHKELVGIAAGPVIMEGMPGLPDAPLGGVPLAHGSGSSRPGPRNQLVGGRLRVAGVGTLLLGLRGPGEGYTQDKRFDSAMRDARTGRRARTS